MQRREFLLQIQRLVRVIERVNKRTISTNGRPTFEPLHAQGQKRSHTPLTRLLVPLGAAFAVGVYSFKAQQRTKPTEPIKSHITNLLSQKQLPKVKYASIADMEKALEEIQQQLKHDEDIISTDENDLLAHGYSEWSSINVDTLPVAVAYPKNTNDVSTIARICHKWRVPIIPYSGGSSIEGHTSAPFGGISLDFAHMDKIVAVNAEDMDVVVQPSVCWTDLNAHLNKSGTGLFFPIDPAPMAKIGGMIGTNCSGTNAVRYGTMRDWVVNVTLVLADGSIIKTRRRPRKSSAGYNLNGIIVGSEGTLGIVTEATLKLAVLPEHYSVAVVPFPNVRSAVAAAAQVIRTGVPVAALELMDEALMRMVNVSGVTQPRVWKETPTLFVKFAGTQASISDNIQSVRDVVARHNAEGFEFAKDAAEQEVLWSARKESLFSILAMRQDGEELWNTDVAVPLSRLADIVEASHQEAAELGLDVFIKGHVGDGNFHENIKYDKNVPESVAKAKVAVKNMIRRALEMEGTCTGEHGVGYGKKESLQAELGDDTIGLMKVIKRALDPHWIMNPGKLFDSPI